jgi:acetoin utilization deacetylase AcuC-like enzyme
MRLFATDRFALPLPPDHRFPIAKYRLLRERVEAEGLGDLVEPHAATDAELELVHDREYLRKIATGDLTPLEARRIGFPWSEALVERSRRSTGATIDAARAALEDGAAVNLAGGTHHACRDHGEGYCVFNDAAVAARVLQREGRAARALVVDCDVHQGNGTASIFAGDPTVYTFSIQAAGNYPFTRARSRLDIDLPDGAGDAEYLRALDAGLTRAVEESRAEVAIYLAGADPWRDDRLGRLKLSKQGLAERDEIVFDHLEAAAVPVAVVMAGGYGRDIRDTVEIHLQTVREAAKRAATIRDGR